MSKNPGLRPWAREWMVWVFFPVVLLYSLFLDYAHHTPLRLRTIRPLDYAPYALKQAWRDTMEVSLAYIQAIREKEKGKTS